MKRNRAFRRFAAVFLALFCMAATSTVAFAGGGGGEPYYTGEETTGGYEPQPLTPEGNMTLVDDIAEDDGVGMPPEVVDRLLTAPAGKSGIGVKNVHERIRLTYGEPYGIQVRSVEDEGTCVTIRLPRRKKGDAV